MGDAWPILFCSNVYLVSTWRGKRIRAALPIEKWPEIIESYALISKVVDLSDLTTEMHSINVP